ncbi:MAG: SemiSWEET transporter [Spirochaetales bacterium]|nr:SemiSWEET transporter [Spirochaetales bacterium]
MKVITIIGFVAAVCTTASFLPQVIKTLRTKQTKDISLLMYIVFTLGVLLWLSYGIIKKDLPIIIANTITFLLAVCVLVLKIKNG